MNRFPRTAIFTVLAVATVAYLWPLSSRVASAFLLRANQTISPIALADCYLGSWILSWDVHGLFTDPLHLFEANVLHPLPHTLALAEHLLAGALLVIPIDLLFHNPILDHNVLVLASYVLSGAGTAFLLRDLGGSTVAGLIAGSLFAFNPLRAQNVGHIQVLAMHWIPFTVLGLQRLLRTGRWRAGAGMAVGLLLTSLSSVYWMYYSTVALATFVVLCAVCRVPVARGAYRRAVVLTAMALLAILPTLIPYAQARDVFALARSPVQTFFFSATDVTYLGAILQPGEYLRTRYVEGTPGIALFGIGTLLLAAIGVGVGAAANRGGRRIAWAYAGVALAMAVLSLGPVLRIGGSVLPAWPTPHRWLARVVPGFDALRVPQRAGAPAVLAMAVLAGLGADGLLRGRRRATRLAAGAIVLGLTVAECWPPHFRLTPVPWAEHAPPVYDWLERQGGSDAVLELPLGDPSSDALFMVMSIRHGHPLVNGYSGFNPAGGYLSDVLARFPDAASLRLLRGIGVGWVIVHQALLPPFQHDFCAQAVSHGHPHLEQVYLDGDSCAFKVVSAPPLPARPDDRPVPLTGARFQTATGSDASAVADGDLGTHWVEPVGSGEPTWLEVDLRTPRPLTRLVVRLGGHFGEYLRTYQVQTSDDGVEWPTVVDQLFGEAPLVDVARTPEDLHQEIRLPGVPIQHLRLVVPPTRDGVGFPLYANWARWGIHELELYESPPPG